jgi:hypothetical protein
MAKSKGNETRFDGPAVQIELARRRGSPGLFMPYKRFCVKCNQNKPFLGGRPVGSATSGLQKCADCLALKAQVGL